MKLQYLPNAISLERNWFYTQITVFWYVKSCGLIGRYKITQRYLQRESHVNILYETKQVFNLCLNLYLCLWWHT
jgi:hypothetical protein